MEARTGSRRPDVQGRAGAHRSPGAVQTEGHILLADGAGDVGGGGGVHPEEAVPAVERNWK